MRWAFQMTVFAALILLFALQIPRQALFFRPVNPPAIHPFAAFVDMDDATYDRVMRRVRLADWSQPFRNWRDGLLDQMAGMSTLEDVPPPPAALSLAGTFAPAPAPRPSALSPLRPSLLPPSLAAPPLAPLPADDVKNVPAVRRMDELMDLDSIETLKERK